MRGKEFQKLKLLVSEKLVDTISENACLSQESDSLSVCGRIPVIFDLPTVVK